MKRGVLYEKLYNMRDLQTYTKRTYICMSRLQYSLWFILILRLSNGACRGLSPDFPDFLRDFSFRPKV